MFSVKQIDQKRIHSIKQNTCRHDQRRVYINIKFDIIIIDSKEDYCLER